MLLVDVDNEGGFLDFLTSSISREPDKDFSMGFCFVLPLGSGRLYPQFNRAAANYTLIGFKSACNSNGDSVQRQLASLGGA